MTLTQIQLVLESNTLKIAITFPFNGDMRVVFHARQIWRCAYRPRYLLALGLELQKSSTEAIAAGYRARIWAKGPTMHTWFSRISMQTPMHRKITWLKSTQIWLKRPLGENTLPNRSPEI